MGEKTTTLSKDTLLPLGLVLTIITSVLGMTWSMSSIKTDIALMQQSVKTIETNYLTQAKAFDDNLEDLKRRQEKQDELISDLKLSLASLNIIAQKYENIDGDKRE